ncbi:TetR/AcrR family transcriptional regulator [Nocardia stercoris]|uniref:TetR/AcrR family transcriptional regulator n=1 Tax=Nocardia stercoris TaxID=2483361 RepID=UPI0018F5BC1B|nr:TetR/AcrR family transcriptional regulator [Nocardia stercoris]
MAGKSRSRLGRDDWIAAALTALAAGGPAAVAVEPLAARLGATKGSAYWHFANRDDLLRAALERWEADETDAVIAVVEVESDPGARLRALLARAFARPDHNLAAALAGSADPVVVAVLTRVTERRIDYLTTLFADAGFPPAAARDRAVLIYSAYLGAAQLWRTVPTALPSTDSAWEHFLAQADSMLLR